MNKYLAYPFALAALAAVSLPAVNFAAYAQQSETQQEEPKPQSDSDSQTPKD